MTITKNTVAIIGAGLIGRSWAVVFARAGARVRVYDPSPQALRDAQPWLQEVLTADGHQDAVANIEFFESLADAVDGVTHVQENAPELLDVKRELYRKLDDLVAPGVPIYSSTSALLPSVLFEGLAGAGRFLVAHPTNPPHVVPVVEIVPSPWTDPQIVTGAETFFLECDQEIVTLQREIPGFLLNRLQAALVNEALRLVDEDVAAPDEIDKVIRSGLGLRWAFIGPFETMDLNSRSGFEDYSARFKAAYTSLDRVTDGASPWDGKVTAKVTDALRKIRPVDQIAERQAWRDRQIVALRKLKETQEHQLSEVS